MYLTVLFKENFVNELMFKYQDFFILGLFSSFFNFWQQFMGTKEIIELILFTISDSLTLNLWI